MRASDLTGDADLDCGELPSNFETAGEAGRSCDSLTGDVVRAGLVLAAAWEAACCACVTLLCTASRRSCNETCWKPM